MPMFRLNITYSTGRTMTYDFYRLEAALRTIEDNAASPSIKSIVFTKIT